MEREIWTRSLPKVDVTVTLQKKDNGYILNDNSGIKNIFYFVERDNHYGLFHKTSSDSGIEIDLDFFGVEHTLTETDDRLYIKARENVDLDNRVGLCNYMLDDQTGRKEVIEQ